jgi:catechol 2,3-dioxygenase-like lactoylglutathione lyase family enzyme
VAVQTNDLAASERFYIDVLGLTRGARHYRPDGTHRATWVHLPDGSFLALEVAGSPVRRNDPDPGLHCLALSISATEREAWRRRLAERGHPVERETGFTLYVRDPDGVLVGLSHHPVCHKGG